MRKYGDMGTLLFREDDIDLKTAYLTGRRVTLRVMAISPDMGVIVGDSRHPVQHGTMIWLANYEEGLTWDE